MVTYIIADIGDDVVYKLCGAPLKGRLTQNKD